MLKLTLPTQDGKPLLLTLHDVQIMAEMPVTWVSHVRAGFETCDCTTARLRFEGGLERVVYRDENGLFVRGGGQRVYLPKVWRDHIGAVDVWAVADVPAKAARRKRSETRPMPETVTRDCVDDIYTWPLGAVMTAKAAGEGWTDCLLMFVDEIRLGGKYNSRRVRYDGAFYIMHNGRRVGIGGALVFDVLGVASHVYGVDAESDKIHNKTLKGY